MQSFNKVERTGSSLPGAIAPFNIAATPDWGNIYQINFAEEIRDWEHRLSLDTAGGYFRARIQKKANQPCWGWALEWNKWLRLIGFFGEETSVRMVTKELVEALPKDQRPILGGYKIQLEVPLESNKDTLFS